MFRLCFVTDGPIVGRVVRFATMHESPKVRSRRENVNSCAVYSAIQRQSGLAFPPVHPLLVRAATVFQDFFHDRLGTFSETPSGSSNRFCGESWISSAAAFIANIKKKMHGTNGRAVTFAPPPVFSPDIELLSVPRRLIDGKSGVFYVVASIQ